MPGLMNKQVNGFISVYIGESNMNNEEELIILVSNIRSNVAVIAIGVCGIAFMIFIGLLLIILTR